DIKGLTLYVRSVELVELGPLTDEDWAVVLDGEVAAFGPVGEALEWLPKDRHLALRDDAGRLVAFVGASVVDVAVDGAGEFSVVGIGSLVVHRDQRGKGLMSQL